MVSTTLALKIVAMIILFCISYLIFVYILLPFNVRQCIQEQREEIGKIEEKIKNARETGNEFIEPFRMKSCTKCIWYNSSIKALEVVFHEEKNPVEIPADEGWAAWAGSNKFNTRESSLNSPGFVYRFHITRFGITECFNCEVGMCEVS